MRCPRHASPLGVPTDVRVALLIQPAQAGPGAAHIRELAVAGEAEHCLHAHDGADGHETQRVEPAVVAYSNPAKSQK